LLPSHHDMNSLLFHALPSNKALPCHKAQNNGAKWPWTETPETMSQNTLFLLLRWLSWVFCHSNRKLTNSYLENRISEYCSVWSVMLLLVAFSYKKINFFSESLWEYREDYCMF
jgi:hypothetical protein